MVDFAKAQFGTDPAQLTISVAPVVSGSTTIELELNPLPDFSITYQAVGSGWEKFNANVLKHAATTIIGALTPFIKSTIKDKAQTALNENASFTVPTVPISVDGIELSITPSDLNISTSGSDYILVTATANIS